MRGIIRVAVRAARGGFHRHNAFAGDCRVRSLRVSSPRFFAVALAAVTILSTLPPITPASAAALRPGDIVVADEMRQAIFRIDPVTGARSILSDATHGSGPAIVQPQRMAIDSRGNIFVTASFGFHSGRVYRVDAETGDRSILSDQTRGTGPMLEDPLGVAVTLDDRVLVADYGLNALVQIDRATGDRTIFAGGRDSTHGSGPWIYAAATVAVEPSGRLLVGGFSIDRTFPLLTVDPTTGARSELLSSARPPLNNGLFDIAPAGPGRIATIIENSYVVSRLTFPADHLGAGLFETISLAPIPNPPESPDWIRNPASLAAENDNSVLVADQEFAAIFRVDMTTGDRSVVSRGSIGAGPNLLSPVAIAIYRGVPEPATFQLAAMVIAGLVFARFTCTAPKSTARHADTDASHRSASSRVARHGLLLIAGAFVSLPAVAADAAALRRGDILVADEMRQAIFRIDPVTGARSILSDATHGSGLAMVLPRRMAVDSKGSIFVTASLGYDNGRVYRVDAETGDRSIVADKTRGTGPVLDQPYGVAVTRDDRVLVADYGLNALVQIDRATGDRTIFTGRVQSGETRGSGPWFDPVAGLSVDPAGHILVSGVGLTQTAPVLAVNPSTGDRSELLKHGINEFYPGWTDLVAAGPGRLAVTGQFESPVLARLTFPTDQLGRGTLIEIDGDPFGGGIGTGRAIQSAYALAAENDNSVLVADREFAAIFRVDMATGDRSVVSRGSIGAGPNLLSPVAIAVYRGVPEPATLLLAASGAIFCLALLWRRRVSTHVAALVAAAILSSADAASAGKVVVVAVNSGADRTSPYQDQPPLLTPGAKGFLIGIDTGPDPIARFYIDDIVIRGPGLVNLEAASPVGFLTQPPKVLFSGEASLQQQADGITYQRDDSYFINAQQLPSGTFFWNQRFAGSPGDGGGAADHFMHTTARSNFVPVGHSPGVKLLAYVVTTTDLEISGVISNNVLGGAGASTDLLGNPVDFVADSDPQITFGATAVLHLDGTIAPKPIMNPPLHAGDLVMSSGSGVSAAVLRVDRATGDRTILSNLFTGGGASLLSPGSIRADGLGSLLVADGDGTEAAVLRIDPVTGDRTVLSGRGAGSGPAFASIGGMERAPDGRLFVVDRQANALLAVDPVTGNRSVVSSAAVGAGPDFAAPGSLLLDRAGQLLVLNRAPGNVSLFRVDPLTGDRTLLSDTNHGFGPDFETPYGLAQDAAGRYLLGELQDPLLQALFRIDPATGDRSVFSDIFFNGTGPSLYPLGMAVDDGGLVLVANADNVLEVDPLTGNRRLISQASHRESAPRSVLGSGPYFDGVRDMHIVPKPVPEPATWLLAVLAVAGVALVRYGCSVRAARPRIAGYFRVRVRAGARRRATLRRTAAIIALFVTGVSASLHYEPARAAALRPGDILVLDDYRSAVFRVDPLTGARSIISDATHGSGPAIVNPRRMAVDSMGNVFVTASFGFQSGRVYRIDAATGNRSILSDATHGSGLGLDNPVGVAVTRDGRVLVADSDRMALVEIDPTTGDRSTFASNTVGHGEWLYPYGVTTDPAGRIVVSGAVEPRSQYDSRPIYQVLEIDVQSRDRTPLFREDPFAYEQRMYSDVAVIDAGRIATTSANSVVGDGELFLLQYPTDHIGFAEEQHPTPPPLANDSYEALVTENDSSLLVVGFAFPGLYRIDVASRSMTIVSHGSIGSGPNFLSLKGIAVFRGVPEPSALVLLAAGAIGCLPFLARTRLVVRYTLLVAVGGFAAAAPANAAKLVVVAVNSGADRTSPYQNQPPLLTPGAKGFLIGLDVSDPTATQLALRNLTFRGSGLVNIEAANPSAFLARPPRIMTSGEAFLQQQADGVAYQREDSYIVNLQQSPEGNFFWNPAVDGFPDGGGAVDDHFLTINARSTLFPSGIAPGVKLLAYVVTTSDLEVTGTISGAENASTDILGNPLAYGNYSDPLVSTGGTALLTLGGDILPKLVVQPPLQSGDIVAANGVGLTAAITRVDRATGDRTILSNSYTGAGPALQLPNRLLGDGAGGLIVTDGAAALFRVDPTTGDRTILSGRGVGGGPSLVNPVGIARAPDGRIVVADPGAHAVFAIDPLTGDRSVVTSNDMPGGLDFSAPTDVLFDQAGQLLVTNGGLGVAALFRVDMVTGARTVISDTNHGLGPDFDGPAGLALDAAGRIVLGERFHTYQSLFYIDPATGDRTVFADLFHGMGAGVSPYDLAIAPDGHLLVANSGNLLEINPVSGDRRVLSQAIFDFGSPSRPPVIGAGFEFPSVRGVYVVPKSVPEPATWLLAALAIVGLGVRRSGKAARQWIARRCRVHVNVRVPRRATLRRTAATIALFAVGASALLHCVPADAAALRPGDILVLDEGRSAVFRVDPVTGARSIISDVTHGSGPEFVRPRYMAIDARGTIFVSAEEEIDGRYAAKLFRIDPATGDRSILSDATHGSGPRLDQPYGLTVMPDGRLLVTNPTYGIFPPQPNLVIVDARTGDRAAYPLAPGSITNFQGISVELDPAGNVLVAGYPVTHSGLRRIDPSTGEGYVVPHGGRIVGFAVAPDGAIFVLPYGNVTGNLIGVEVIDGAGATRRTISGPQIGSGLPFVAPAALAIEADAQLIVGDYGLPGIFRVDPVTGDRTLLSKGSVGSGPNILAPISVAIVRSVPEPSTLALLAIGTLFCGWRFGRRRYACAIAFVAALAGTATASASPARLVVMAVNSGSDLTAPYRDEPPLLTPGAKGFLIGVDTGDVPYIGVQLYDITFRGTGLVNFEGLNLAAGHLASPPRIQTRTEAANQGLADGIAYRREDTYAMNEFQRVGDFNFVWDQRYTTYGGGAHSDPYFSVTGSSNVSTSFLPPGVRLLAYVVTTSELEVTGNITAGSIVRQNAPDETPVYDTVGNRVAEVGVGRTGILRLDGTLTPKLIQNAPLQPGEIVFTEGRELSAGLARIDPVTGARQVISNAFIGSGPKFDIPSAVVGDAQGMLYVADHVGADAVLLRVDPITGNRAILSGGSFGSGPSLVKPQGLVARGNELFVADGKAPGIIAVDLATGNRRIVSGDRVGTGPLAWHPAGLTFDRQGNLLVTTGGTGMGAVVRVDPATGDRSIVSDTVRGGGPDFDFPFGIVVDADGRIVVAESHPKFQALFHVDPVTGDRSVFSDFIHGTGPLPFQFTDLALDATGQLISAAGMLKIDPMTGDRSPVPTDPRLYGASGIHIVPKAVPEPATWLLAMIAVAGVALAGPAAAIRQTRRA